VAKFYYNGYETSGFVTGVILELNKYRYVRDYPVAQSEAVRCLVCESVG